MKRETASEHHLGKLPASLACFVCLSSAPTKELCYEKQCEDRRDHHEHGGEQDATNSDVAKRVTILSDSVNDAREITTTSSESNVSDSQGEGLDLTRNLKTRFEVEAKWNTQEQNEVKKRPANVEPKFRKTETILQELLESHNQIKTSAASTGEQEEQEAKKSPTSEPRAKSPVTIKPPCTVKGPNDESQSIIMKRNQIFIPNALSCLDYDIDDDNLWFDMPLEVFDSLDTFLSYDDYNSLSSHYM
jgi:hypothetical protein